MSTQMTHKRPRIAQIITTVLAILVAAIVFAPQAGAAGAPAHIKNWGGVAFPGDSAMDSNGNIYLLNAPNDRVQKFTKDGVLIKEWGGHGSDPGELDHPQGLGIDSQDRVYVADSSNNRVQKFTADGGLIKVIGGLGTGNGKFEYPTDVAAGQNDTIYVTDSGNDRVQRFNAGGTYLSKWGTTGNGSSQFNNGIFGIATDPAGNVYVSEVTHDRIQKFSHNGTYLTKWGNKGTEQGEFNNPVGLAVDGEGNLLVADSNNNRIQAFTGNGAFAYSIGKSGNGAADMSHPSGVSVHDDRVYVSDQFHGRIQVFGHELPIAIPEPKKEEDPQGEQPNGEADPIPAPGEATFDGTNLHIRLKCPKRFQPSCHTTAMPMTKKHRGKPMAKKPVRKKLAANDWTVVSFVIKPKYRAKVDKMTDRGVKLLNVTQTIRSKRIRSKKSQGPSKVFHVYRVRSAGK